MTENDTLPSVPLADKIDSFIQRIGMSVAWCYVLLVLVIILQVVLRKGLHSGLIVLEELQWHLYAVGVMFGLSFAQVNNSHIRVDLFYTHFRTRTKRIIEILGTIFLVMPFIVIIFLHGMDFFHESYRINESSSSPSGLPYRWLIKGVIPVTFALLGLAVLSRLYREIVLLKRGE